MSIKAIIIKEVADWSKWFKAGVALVSAVYLLFWIFTISLHYDQKAAGIHPLLPVMAQDSEGYYNLSESLIKGNGFSQNGELETLRTPGYPVFAAAIKIVGRSYFITTLVQIVLVIATALIIRKIGALLVSRPVGETAALLFLVNPVTLTLSLIILTDTLFIFLFVLSFYLVVSLDNRNLFLKALVVSIVSAAAIYTRLGLYALPMFLAPILTLGISIKSKLRLAVGVVAIVLVLVSPWALRNYFKVGIFGYTSFRSQNLGWAATKFMSSVNGTSQSQEYLNFIEKIGIESSDYYDIEYSDQIGAAAEEIIFSQPFAYSRYHLISSLPFLFPSTISFALDTYNSALHQAGSSGEGAINLLSAGRGRDFLRQIMNSWWKVAERLGWLLAYLLFLLVIWSQRKKATPWVLAFIVVYLMLLAGPASGPRYSFQAFPFIFISFAWGASALFSRRTKVVDPVSGGH